MNLLNEIEKKILNDIFEMYINNGPVPKLINYDLQEINNPDPKLKWYEFGSYLLKLRSLGFIKFEDNIYTTGGWTNPKYRNSILNVQVNRVQIDKDGIGFIVNERETLQEKVVQGLKSTGIEVVQTFKTGVIGAIVGAFIMWITTLYFL